MHSPPVCCLLCDATPSPPPPPLCPPGSLTQTPYPARGREETQGVPRKNKFVNEYFFKKILALLVCPPYFPNGLFEFSKHSQCSSTEKKFSKMQHEYSFKYCSFLRNTLFLHTCHSDVVLGVSPNKEGKSIVSLLLLAVVLADPIYRYTVVHTPRSLTLSLTLHPPSNPKKSQHSIAQ